MPWEYSWKASQRRWPLDVLKSKEELFLQIKKWVGVGKDTSGRILLALKLVGTKFLLPNSPLLWKILLWVVLCGVGVWIGIHSLKSLDCQLLKGRIMFLLDFQHYLKGAAKPVRELESRGRALNAQFPGPSLA